MPPDECPDGGAGGYGGANASDGETASADRATAEAGRKVPFASDAARLAARISATKKARDR